MKSLYVNPYWALLNILVRKERSELFQLTAVCFLKPIWPQFGIQTRGHITGYKLPDFKYVHHMREILLLFDPDLEFLFQMIQSYFCFSVRINLLCWDRIGELVKGLDRERVFGGTCGRADAGNLGDSDFMDKQKQVESFSFIS